MIKKKKMFTKIIYRMQALEPYEWCWKLEIIIESKK